MIADDRDGGPCTPPNNSCVGCLRAASSAAVDTSRMDDNSCVGCLLRAASAAADTGRMASATVRGAECGTTASALALAGRLSRGPKSGKAARALEERCLVSWGRLAACAAATRECMSCSSSSMLLCAAPACRL